MSNPSPAACDIAAAQQEVKIVRAIDPPNDVRIAAERFKEFRLMTVRKIKAAAARENSDGASAIARIAALIEAGVIDCLGVAGGP